MINIERGKEFLEYVNSIIGYYDGNIQKITLDANDDIFSLIKNRNTELIEIPIKNINIGKFYLIKYDYDGNLIYCPIFTIEYRNINNKNIIYAINLDYLPFDYKINFINILISKYIDIFNKNQDLNSVLDEKPFNDITFESIYKILKNNGNYDYAITAYDVLKIKNIYSVSTNLLYKFVFIHTRYINIDNIKKRIKVDDNDINRTKLEKILNDFILNEKEYNKDVKMFYKRLKSIESNYKLL